MQNEQLIVKYIPVKNCFIHLPNAWLRKLLSTQIGVIKVINNEIDYYFSCMKSQSSPCNSLCISATFAKCLNIVEGTYLNVFSVSDPPVVTSIIVTAQSEHDLAIVKLRADKIQEIILHQISIVAKNQAMVVWLSKGLYVTLMVNSIMPNFQYGKLEQYTEIHVLDTIGNVETPTSPTKKNCDTVLPTDNTNSCSELLNNYQDKTFPPIFRVCFLPKSHDFNINDPFNMEIESFYNIFMSLSQSVKFFPANVGNKCFFSNLKILPGNQQRDSKKNVNFLKPKNLFDEISEIIVRVIITENAAMYLGKDNQELLNNMAVKNGNNIIVSQSLRKQLHLQLGDRVHLISIKVTQQKIDQINIFPSDKNVTREMLDNYFGQHFPTKKFLLNSGTRIFLTDQISCGIQLVPENCAYTLLHEDKMKDVNIYIKDVVPVESSDYYPSSNCGIHEISCHYVCLQTMQDILFECRTIFSMTLNLSTDGNHFICDRENILICGNIGGGKSTLCKILNEKMQQPPHYFFTCTLQCKKLKGKKVEAINKLFTTIMNDCQYHQPSILFIDDLESITNSMNDEENSPDAINAARIADCIISIITSYQSTNLINIMATCTNIDKLGNQLRSLRGVNLFRTVIKIPGLSLKNRCDILKATLTSKLHISDEIPWDYYGNKTEGWTPQDLIDLAEKATFIAWKRQTQIKYEPSTVPIVDNEDLSDAYNRCKPISLHGVTLYSGGNNWSDIGGLKCVKDSLIQLLQWPLIYSGLFKNAPVNQQSGVLLYGMPGTGKTMIAGAIAKECGLNFINIKGPELISKYIGASEEAVRNIFHKAQCAKPCVLFFDEFESFAPRRGHDSTGVTDRVVNQLLTEFDGVEGREGVAIVAASSRPDLLDPALLRPGRLDKSLLCPLPGENEREEILQALCTTHNIDMTGLNLQILARNTANFTGADLNAILTQARMNAFEKNGQFAMNENLKTIDGIKITQNDLVVALETTQPSLTAVEIAKFHEIYRKFSKGDGFTEELLNNLKSTLA